MFKKLRGFTLTELLIVMSIIGILATITLVGIKSAREKSKVSKVKTDVSNITLSITNLYTDTRRYPGGQRSLKVWYKQIDGSTPLATTENDINGIYEIKKANTLYNGIFLNNNGSFWGATAVGWNGPYYTGATVDPWGKSYFFTYRYRPQRRSDTETVRMTSGVASAGKDNAWGVGCDDIYSVMYSEDDATVPPVTPPPSCPNFDGQVN